MQRGELAAESARRPGEVTSTENVAMQVRHGLAAVRAVVDDEAVARFVQAEFRGDLGGFQQQVAEKFLVIRRCLGDAWDGLLGNDDDVCGRLRLDVAEGEDGVVFKNNGGGDFARGDFFKQGFAHKT